MESNNNYGEGHQQLRRSARKRKCNEHGQTEAKEEQKQQEPPENLSKKKRRQQGNGNDDLEVCTALLK
jgi:hypothetical protein